MPCSFERQPSADPTNTPPTTAPSALVLPPPDRRDWGLPAHSGTPNVVGDGLAQAFAQALRRGVDVRDQHGDTLHYP